MITAIASVNFWSTHRKGSITYIIDWPTLLFRTTVRHNPLSNLLKIKAAQINVSWSNKSFLAMHSEMHIYWVKQSVLSDLTPFTLYILGCIFVTVAAFVVSAGCQGVWALACTRLIIQRPLAVNIRNSRVFIRSYSSVQPLLILLSMLIRILLAGVQLTTINKWLVCSFRISAVTALSISA